MGVIPAEFQPEVERIVQKRLAEQAEAIKVAGIDKSLASVRRELASFRRETTKRLDDSNHLRELLASKADLAAALAPIEAKLAGVVVVQQIGDGDYTVTFGDVTLGPEDLDELPLITKASRDARASAASAHKAADRAEAASTLRSLWVTAAATALAALVTTTAALTGFIWFLHLRGVL